MRIRIPGITVRVGQSSARRILGVDTTTAAFVGAPDTAGPADPLLVTGLHDYDAQFGTADDELRRAIRLHFENRGRRAYVLRPQSDIVDELGKLDDVSFALLAIPDLASLDPDDAATVAAAAIEYCELRRAFMVVDAPAAVAPDDLATWAESLGASRHAAIYVPHLKVPGATTPASGAVVGIIARTDTERGVWRAPAGVGATVRGVLDVTAVLSDSTITGLAQSGVNAVLPYAGRPVVWGARTLAASDPDWRYVNVSRYAIFLERSIEEGTRWAVFEPNDEPLWREIRSTVGTFMLEQFRQGALAASTPEDAYFVRCDRTTMTQDDIDNGRLVTVVGFAPLRPAEFVVFRIG